MPRYRPVIELSAWLRLLAQRGTTVAEERRRNLDRLRGVASTGFACDLAYARQGLKLYFADLRRATGGGTVLAPAHICSAAVDSVTRAGLSVAYVDADVDFPTPSAQQFAEAIDARTVAVLVAPLYGYLQADWSPLLRRLGDVKLVLDLAQGLTLIDDIDAELVRSADGLIYSFGLGKGPDTGGGVLLTRRAVDAPKRRSIGGPAWTLLAAALIRFLIASGLYRFVTARVDERVENEKSSPRTFRERRLPAAIHLLWSKRIAKFHRDVELARDRARELSGVLAFAQNLITWCGNESGSHLRYVLRFRTIELRDAVMRSLKARQIDCAPAGEELGPASSLPNALAFRAQAIRLPFIGRLREREYRYLRESLESAIAEHLSD